VTRRRIVETLLATIGLWLGINMSVGMFMMIVAVATAAIAFDVYMTKRQEKEDEKFTGIDSRSETDAEEVR
jgi:ABC-type nickel/cobalt efflux system permease component RcnA